MPHLHLICVSYLTRAHLWVLLTTSYWSARTSQLTGEPHRAERRWKLRNNKRCTNAQALDRQFISAADSSLESQRPSPASWTHCTFVAVVELGRTGCIVKQVDAEEHENLKRANKCKRNKQDVHTGGRNETDRRRWTYLNPLDRGW
jgi:hypothetical protein